eukprot:4286893-Alexandrium_andersonii.AAC.1
MLPGELPRASTPPGRTQAPELEGLRRSRARRRRRKQAEVAPRSAALQISAGAERAALPGGPWHLRWRSR